jgi:hypothetical protein
VPKDNRKLPNFFVYVRQRDNPAAIAAVDAEILFAKLKEEGADVKAKARAKARAKVAKAQARAGPGNRAEATTKVFGELE